jgi:CRP/FNR family transcriptional regulator
MLKARILEQISCQTCPSSHLCIAADLDSEAKSELDALITKVRNPAKGAHVFHIQEPVKNLYAVYSGSCKEYWIDENGNECITNFYFPGDLIGIESISNRKHLFSVSTLEDTVLCTIPLDAFLELMQTHGSIMKRFINIASQKMQNDQCITMGVTATERVCDFLMNITTRMLERSYNEDEIHLPMSQLDISNYLGIAYETFNLILKKLKSNDVIKLKNKTMRVLDITELESQGRIDYEFKKSLK